jgi:hypothetical protein
VNAAARLLISFLTALKSGPKAKAKGAINNANAGHHFPLL